MTRTDFDNFLGSFTVTEGRVDTESLSEDSSIDLDKLGILQLSLAHLVQATASMTITISHTGPRSLSGSGKFMKLGEGYLDMFRTDSRRFNGLFAIEDGTVDTGALGEDSSITIGGQGTMLMSLAHLVQITASMTITISHAGPLSLSGSGKFMKLGKGTLDMKQATREGLGYVNQTRLLVQQHKILFDWMLTVCPIYCIF